MTHHDPLGSAHTTCHLSWVPQHQLTVAMSIPSLLDLCETDGIYRERIRCWGHMTLFIGLLGAETLLLSGSLVLTGIAL